MGDMADADAIHAESYEMLLEDMEVDLLDGVWTTSDGNRVLVTEMSDTHIFNTIKLLVNGRGGDMATRWIVALSDEQERRATENEMAGLAMGFDEHGGGNQ